MTANEIFYYLFGGGKYSLPYLVKFTCPGIDDILLVNSKTGVTFNGETYRASTFSYTEPDLKCKGGSLKVEFISNNLINFTETADEQMKIEVVGCIQKDGSIEQYKIFQHMYVSISYDSTMTMNVTLNPDNRLSMTFPPYVFDSDNNRGGN